MINLESRRLCGLLRSQGGIPVKAFCWQGKMRPLESLGGIFLELVFLEAVEGAVALAVELEVVVVELEERGAVADGEERDLELARLRVQDVLDVQRYGAGALVQDGELGLVVEETGHGDALLLASRQDLGPVVDGVVAAFSLDEVAQLHFIEDLQQVPVGRALLRRLVGVDDLVAQAAHRQVWSLRNVEQVIELWPKDLPSEQGPELAEYSETRALAAAVGSRDDAVIAGVDLGHRRVP